LIYFDSAASYPVLPEVQRTLQEAFSELYGNSTASHKIGMEASDKIEEARELFANTVGALKSEIIFTSGATESNNTAFKSCLLNKLQLNNKRHIVTTEIEHNCILAICHYLQEYHDYEVTYVKPDSDGLVSLKGVQDALRIDTALVSVMHVNNELGTINPIAEIGKLCFEKGILFHSDAAQSFCKVPIDVDDLNVDLMSFSAHKIGGPKGIGALYIRDLRKKTLVPIIHGAGHEEGIRGGTVAAPLICAFAKAIQRFPAYYADLSAKNFKQLLFDIMEDKQINYQVNGASTQSLPNITSISIPNIDLGLMLRETDMEMSLAQGSACSSKQIEPSHVLTSLGINRNISDKTLRVSFSHHNSEEDIRYLASKLDLYCCR
jgi:cysteine desulfurase